MELAGGLILGLTLMFSLLAFYPSSQFSAARTTQVAGVGSAEVKMEPTPKKQVFTLSSAVFSNGSTTPVRYMCDGSTGLTTNSINISPPLFISGVPEKTQSLVLMMDDPDAPNGAWTHWVMFNIPPTVHEIAEGKEPPGRAGKNSWGKIGYGAPCPPKGKEHRYIFHLYALSRTLPLRVGSPKTKVLDAMRGYILAQAELTARYKRSK